MTDPIRNRQSSANRSRLLLGCGSAALALALVLAPQRAEAQGIQASGDVTFGNADITTTGPNDTNINVFTPTTVIDWTPFQDAAGNALTFLPQGSTATYQTSINGGFSVLNRILPSTNGNVVAIDGNVISRMLDANGIGSPGGFIAFYSPTGILVGSTATFDVGSLMLTTLDTGGPIPFEQFSIGGGMTIAATPGSTARIQINPGAQILATPENAFFAVIAADVQMSGTALVNGSHAFVAAEVVNLSFSNGLFNISVPVGTAASGTVLNVNGTVGGPSSTGIGDNHMIYGVARAAADPISMLFSGNLGFDPAQSVGIVNGEIILSGNYDVFGRFVAGGSISDGINAVFSDTRASNTNATVELYVSDINASSSLLAISEGLVNASAGVNGSSVDGNLLLVAGAREGFGAGRADLVAAGAGFTITGDLLVAAQDYGVVSSSLQSLDSINAQGGVATMTADLGGTITVEGSALVTADAFAGADSSSRIAGTARGGQALIRTIGGSLEISGNATVRARAIGSTIGDIIVGAESRGGQAEFDADFDGTITVGLNAVMNADAFGADGSLFSQSSVSNAYGGQAGMSVGFQDTGTITIGGDVLGSASGFGGSSNNAGLGSVGDGGAVTVNVLRAGLIDIGGGTQLEAQGVGGDNGGGTGGTGFGGRASSSVTNGGTITFGGTITNSFLADASGEGGDGLDGGSGFGGLAGAIAEIGAITTDGLALAISDGLGGSATFGFGGNGGLGRGGNAFFQANGTLTQTATLTIGGDASAFAQGIGGEGGQSDGSIIPAGRGGDGYGGEFSVPNQADPLLTSGVFILGGGDNGNLTVLGETLAIATGEGGRGGFGGTLFDGGRGGNGFGGLTQIGLSLVAQGGSLGLGVANFGNVVALANGFGGQGGGSGFDFPTGDGGNGTGGLSVLTVLAGDVTANAVRLEGLGVGGEGRLGGIGTGGGAATLGNLGGTLTAAQFVASASGFGGSSAFGAGGLGRGGEAAIELQGITVNISGETIVEATGVGGLAEGGTAGDGTGGTAYIAVVDGTPGSGTFTGNTAVVANGFGGIPGDGGTGGTGRGGLAYVQAQSASTLRFGSLQVTATGRGGESEDNSISFIGGAGFGGAAELRSLGSGSNLIIERNFDASLYGNELNSGAIVAALGIGGITADNSTNSNFMGIPGVGGAGTGGSILLRAAQGGAIALPANPNSDPGSAGFNRLLARGFGGGSSVEGGSGGSAQGGIGLIEVDGGTLTMGETLFSVFSQGGSSLLSTNNITGGNAFGGTRRIRVLNGGTATLDLIGGVAGGVGGNGSGTGNGGNGFGGRSELEVIGSTLNIVGTLIVVDQVTGGNGRTGGNAFESGEGGLVSFTADQATINFVPNAAGQSGLAVGGINSGGTGEIAGGNARSTPVLVNITGSTFTGGRLEFLSTAQGGAATGPGGIGGNATSTSMAVNIAGSQINLLGESIFAVDAVGGSGANDGTGGNATSANIDLVVASSTVALAGDARGGQGILRVRSQAVGGLGGVIGNAVSARASLSLAQSTLDADAIAIEARAFAVASSAGQVGGSATGGLAQFVYSGQVEVDTGAISITGNAETSSGGSAQAGTASLQGSGSQSIINTTVLNLLADANGGDPGIQANGAGRFLVNLSGGDVNAGSVLLTALGDAVSAAGSQSQLFAQGGNLNVSGALDALAYGDIRVETASGSVIGSQPVGGTTTSIFITAQGGLEIVDDNGGTVSLGGQAISLTAGRSILLDANLAVADGTVSIFANVPSALPLPPGPAGPATITMVQGSSINAGTGSVTLRLFDGAGQPGRDTGAITLANITAGSIDARNLGTTAGSDINVIGSGVLTASGTGRAIDLASLNGEVINLHGDAGLILTGGGHYGIFAATPTGSQIGSFGNYARRYNVADETAYDALNPGGNFAAFRIVPVLTVTADDVSRFYGDANPGFTASFAGFLPGDSIADLLGAPLLDSLADNTSNVGLYTITAALGSLLSEQGYQFTFNPGQLTVTPRPITVTADNLTRIYGNANPTLTFTVGGAGLVNGDQLFGGLATLADGTTGVGSYAITQGTLAASSNYDLTFVDGQLTITPRSLIVTADSFSRIYGDANPALTYILGGDGLVNGDQISGALTTVAGVTTGIGDYAITQGTLAASANYTLSFVDGVMTIVPRPITVTADNLTRIYGDANPALTFTVGGAGLVNGDQLGGALATLADVTTGIGNAAITQGTLDGGGNYAISFVNGQLTITPRPITVTADNITRIYGNANPALTFTVGGAGLVNGDQLFGSLETLADVTTGVGSVAITQGNLAASSNYDLTFVDGQLTITPRALTVTADDLTRIYGNANPALTFTVGGDGLVNGDQLFGGLATLADGTTGVGSYAITQGTLAASSNYTLTFVDGQLTITPRSLIVTADSFSRIYGDANPALTYILGGDGLVNGDQLSGALTTVAGVTTGIGDYAITQGTLAASANYTLSFVDGVMTIVPRSITVTADSFTRHYGDANDPLTFTVGGAGLVNGDQLSGELATLADLLTGIGEYQITQGTLTAGANYDLVFTHGQISINPRPITVTADSLSRIYGNANPALTFTVGGAGLVNGDQLFGSLSTLADVTTGVGSVAITQGNLAASSNYTLTFVDGQLTITPRALTVTADNLSRIYGNANPALTFTVGGDGLVNGDQLGGALATLAGVTTGVGNVAITQGTLAASSNYTLTFVDGQLSITPRPITITADSLSRIYGNANPALTFTVGGDGLVNGDQLSGALATLAGVTTGVGNVAITQGTLAASANYSITFVNGQLTITPRPITVTADNITRIYGDANPALTFTVGGSGLVNGDQLGGALATAAGLATGVGNALITQGTLNGGGNYAISFVNGQLTITPRPITVTANNLTRIYGNSNPALTFTVGGAGLVNGDLLSGALATTAGVTTGVGNVLITQGTLSAGSNYAVSFVNGQLAITPRPITITADDLSKLLGQPDPVLTFTIGGNGLVNNDTLSGSLSRDPGEAIGAFAIRQGTLDAGGNYLTTFVPGELSIGAPPAPAEINSPTVFEGPVASTEPAPAAEDEEEEQFGMDFPAQPDAQLIAEDTLLDEPVTSGGDASLYGGGITPPAGGQ